MAHDRQAKEEILTESDKISIEIQTHDNNPKSFLQYHHFTPERDIRISVRLNVNDVKRINIIDLNAQQDLCGHRHTRNVSFHYFSEPVNIKELFSMISTPCLHQRSARLKLTVETTREKLFRIHTFPIADKTPYYQEQ